MRSEQTPAEKELWRAIRNRRLGGFKFRRQVPIDRYIADFLCVECRLILELDGASHSAEGEPENDAKRTERLATLVYDVVRIENTWVHENLFGVLERIYTECSKRRPPDNNP